MHILIVDDDDIAVEMMRAALEEAGGRFPIGRALAVAMQIADAGAGVGRGHPEPSGGGLGQLGHRHIPPDDRDREVGGS